MSRLVGKSTMWFPNRSDTNHAVQAQKMDRDWKFWLYKVEELYYTCSENKVAAQLRSYCEADLRLCFHIADCWFSHEAAQIRTVTYLPLINDMNDNLYGPKFVPDLVIYLVAQPL